MSKCCGCRFKSYDYCGLFDELVLLGDGCPFYNNSSGEDDD